MTGESSLYQELREQVRWPWLERVESRAVANGLPDTHFVAYEHRGWIELKKEPTLTPENLVPLRKGQVAWHAAYAQAGGCSWIIFQAGKSYFMWPGAVARFVRKNPLRIAADKALIWGDKVSFYNYLAEF